MNKGILIGIIGVLLIIGSSTMCASSNSSNSVKQPSDIGATAILQYTDDPEILLAVDKEAHEQLGNAFLAKDWAGVAELISAGKVFGVPQGLKVLVIDRDYGIRKVRIQEGEFINRAGWVVEEALVNQ